MTWLRVEKDFRAVMGYDYLVFDLSWQKIVLWGSFIFFLAALLLRQEAAINQDLGRHLRLGQAIVENNPPGARRQALATNFLTYTHPEYPFVNHHWGSEAIFYLIYKLDGFGGLILFKALVLEAAFGITVLHASGFNKFNKGPALGFQGPGLIKLASAIGITFFSAQMMADRLTTRPEIFGYLLFSLLFWILDRNDLSSWRNLPNLLLIPIIMIFWVNLHISFVFGLIMVWIWAFASLVNKGPALRSKAGPYHGLAVAIISTLAAIFNPAGVRGALMPVSIMKDYGYTIVENMTPFFLRAFKPQPEYWIYALILLAAITIGAVRKLGGIGVFRGITLLVFSVFPLIAVRHLAFFALVMPVALTPLLAEVLKGPALRRKAGPYHAVVLVATGLFLAAVTNPAPLSYAKLPPVGLGEDKRHEAAVRFVKNHLPRQGRGEQGRMWNNYDIGSFLEWSLPEYKTFVDGRPEAFPAGFFQETYIPMQESRQKWDEVVKEHDIKWVFAALTDATPWFAKWRQMIGAHEGWRVVYIDSATAILERQN